MLITLLFRIRNHLYTDLCSLKHNFIYKNKKYLLQTVTQRIYVEAETIDLQLGLPKNSRQKTCVGTTQSQ